MSLIEMYTRPGCGYCLGAKQLLNDNGLEFVELDVMKNPKNKLDMNRRTTNKTYPQIFIDDVSIGGYEEFLKLSNQELSELRGSSVLSNQPIVSAKTNSSMQFNSYTKRQAS